MENELSGWDSTIDLQLNVLNATATVKHWEINFQLLSTWIQMHLLLSQTIGCESCELVKSGMQKSFEFNNWYKMGAGVNYCS